MSRYNPDHNVEPIFSAVEKWRDSCLIDDRSILTTSPLVWTRSNVHQLQQAFTGHPDTGPDPFLVKLRRQIQNQAPAVIQLAAEMLWVTLLFPSNIGVDKKRSMIMEIMSWLPVTIETDQVFISNEVLEGIGNPGVAYFIKRPNELEYFLDISASLKDLDVSQRRSILSDPWGFSNFLSKVPISGTRQFSHIIEHLLFPDTFERISTGEDKRRILVTVGHEDPMVAKQLDRADRDRRLFELRKSLASQRGNSNFDFYDEEFAGAWKDTNTGSDAAREPETPQLTFAALVNRALGQLKGVRIGPFAVISELWSTMDKLLALLTAMEPLKDRPHIFGKWSLGKGVWAKVPWIALLNCNVTTSTQVGLYIVFLFSEDLSHIYLTLNQGMTELVREHGETEARTTLKKRAAQYRDRVPELEHAGFTLGDEIDLRSNNWRAKNYQPSTIAFFDFNMEELPNDEKLQTLLEALLEAYDHLVETDSLAKTNMEAKTEAEAEAEADAEAESEAEAAPYTLDDALEGVFFDRAQFEEILELLRDKKNLVLQGAPGVGKSFIARRLAYALIGRRDDLRIGSVQFHQAYSYEDFIQGYKPNAQGGFELRNGIFHRFCRQAIADHPHVNVFIIDEINRGNLSKIFGELMLLIEGDKRSQEWGTQLAYAKDGDQKFYVPDNLYLVGMMNTADRSLSMVDYALRRRFAFHTLSPAFASSKFRAFLAGMGIPENHIEKICVRMGDLNRSIYEDLLNLGPGYQIGHSFFMPKKPIKESNSWYRRVVNSEIVPLLGEYWFDSPEKVEFWRKRLVEDL